MSEPRKPPPSREMGGVGGLGGMIPGIKGLPE